MASQAPVVYRPGNTNPANIQDLAIQVFEDEAAADHWLHQPNMAMNKLAPIELLKTPEGEQQVRTTLLQIEYGVLA